MNQHAHFLAYTIILQRASIHYACHLLWRSALRGLRRTDSGATISGDGQAKLARRLSVLLRLRTQTGATLLRQRRQGLLRRRLLQVSVSSFSACFFFFQSCPVFRKSLFLRIFCFLPKDIACEGRLFLIGYATETWQRAAHQGLLLFSG